MGRVTCMLGGIQRRIARAKSSGAAARRRALDACLLWFFDTYLKGETPPFPTNPEIYNLQRK